MKTTKILVLALAFCLALTSLTAFADVNVTTVTNYDYEAEGTAAMEVTATVSGAEEGAMVTYYVSKGSKIIYLDQFTSTGSSFDFQFEATKDTVIGATAKNGSNKGYAFDAFTFATGCNFLSTGAANAELVEYKPASELGIDGVTNGYAFTCKVNGNAKEYGVKLGTGEFQAFGSNPNAEDATYVVIIEGISAAEAATVTAYAK